MLVSAYMAKHWMEEEVSLGLRLTSPVGTQPKSVGHHLGVLFLARTRRPSDAVVLLTLALSSRLHTSYAARCAVTEGV